MKTLCMLVAASLSFASIGASPSATVDWVKTYISGLLAGNEPAKQPDAMPEVIQKTFSSSMRGDDGHEYEVSITLATADKVALIVTDSTVAGVSNGTVYAWNAAFSQFETIHSSFMPVIVAESYNTVDVTTNLFGSVNLTTNAVVRYRASTASGDYWSTLRYGLNYLISSAGFAGQTIRFSVSHISDAMYAVANPPVLAGKSFLPFAAFAETTSLGGSGAEHVNGAIIVNKITIKRKGKEEEIDFAGESVSFNSGVGTGSVGEYTEKSFADWYNDPQSGIYQSRKNDLANLVNDYANGWGLPDGSEKIDLGDDQMAIRYQNLYDSGAWMSAMTEARDWLNNEYTRIFGLLHAQLKIHVCPGLKADETIWTPEMNCKCRHSWPDLMTGEDVKCEMHDISQHNWQIYKLVGKSLSLSTDGVGCTLCARCLQSSEDEGAIHVTVPDEWDWCGCYCGKYYEKKAEEEEDEAGDEEYVPPYNPPSLPPYDQEEEEEETPPAEDTPDTEEPEVDCGGDDAVIEDVDQIVDVPVVEQEDGTLVNPDESTTEITQDKIVLLPYTNNVPVSALRPFWHVTKAVKDAFGRSIKVITSKGGLMDSPSAADKHSKPQHPLKCTCKCGREHWFKKSPCPHICRGCGYADDAFFAGQVDHTERNHNLRGNHTTMAEGCWTELETYIRRDPETGKKETVEWTNKDGSAFVRSPYADWYYATTTGGVKACGCACKRFWTDDNGSHGRPGRDLAGNKVDSGHHGSFHIYSFRPASEIACPFSHWYYCEHLGKSDEMLPSCSCNNHEWEIANPHTKFVGDYSDIFWKGDKKWSDDVGSLACKDTCRWHWPSNHYHSAGALTYHTHTGIQLRNKLLSNEIINAHDIWLAAIGGAVCGCACQIVNKETCLSDDGTASETTLFDVRWSDLKSHFHAYDLRENCKCLCEMMHFCVTPESMEEYYPDIPAKTLSKCSAEMGVCDLCGYYNKSGLIKNLERAAPDEHVYRGGVCGCDCGTDGTDPIFEPKAGYSGPVRGWTAAQDGDRYPNNTREGSPGDQYKTGDKFETYHGSAKRGCLCSCADEVGHHLYHNHVPGETCTSVCKGTPISGVDSICEHAPQYYELTKDSGGYTDLMGAHTRSADADYCGCDCGHKITRIHQKDGLPEPWHVAPDGECYCYGRYAEGSPHDHGDAALVEHLNLAATGNIVTNTLTCSQCGVNYETYAREFKCDNDHVVTGKSWGDPPCGHFFTCPRGCTCCDLKVKACTCPWCNMVIGAVDFCTCNGVGTDGRILKISFEYITSENLKEIIKLVYPTTTHTIDGDDPVLGIDPYSLTNAFNNMTALTTVKFNYVTELCEGALKTAFIGCKNLERVEFNRLFGIDYYGFSSAFDSDKKIVLDFPELVSIFPGAFKGSETDQRGLTGVNFPKCTWLGRYCFFSCKSLEYANLPMCEDIGHNAFENCKALRSINIPNVTVIDEYAFYNCSSLESISMPKCEYLDHLVFGSCVSLTNAVVTGCVEVGPGAFDGCKSLRSINLPKTEKIDISAFWGTYALKEISIPECKEIGETSFFNSGLERLSAPNVTNVLACAFENCTNLVEVNLTSCTKMRREVFKGCTSLRTARLPVITNIGQDTFLSTSLTNAVLSGMSSEDYDMGANHAKFPSGCVIQFKDATVTVP